MVSGAVYESTIVSETQVPYKIYVMDADPAGLVVLANNADGSSHITLSPSPEELAAANVRKNPDGYEKLVSSLSINVNAKSGELELESSLEGIRAALPPATAANAETYLTTVPAGKDTLSALLSKGLTELCREKPVGVEAIEWLGKWLLQNNPNQPQATIK